MWILVHLIFVAPKKYLRSVKGANFRRIKMRHRISRANTKTNLVPGNIVIQATLTWNQTHILIVATANKFPEMTKTVSMFFSQRLTMGSIPTNTDLITFFSFWETSLPVALILQLQSKLVSFHVPAGHSLYFLSWFGFTVPQTSYPPNSQLAS